MKAIFIRHAHREKFLSEYGNSISEIDEDLVPITSEGIAATINQSYYFPIL